MKEIFYYWIQFFPPTLPSHKRENNEKKIDKTFEKVYSGKKKTPRVDFNVETYVGLVKSKLSNHEVCSLTS